jgi:uncharacterized integral membrane protein
MLQFSILGEQACSLSIAKDAHRLRPSTHTTPATTSAETSLTLGVIPKSTTGPVNYELPAPNTARARESAAAVNAVAQNGETRAGRFRRNAHQGRLHIYAIAVIALVAVLIALAATNTARVHVDWLIGSSRVSLVWLVLVAAIIGWIIGVVSSARFQWLTRAPRP